MNEQKCYHWFVGCFWIIFTWKCHKKHVFSSSLPHGEVKNSLNKSLSLWLLCCSTLLTFYWDEEGEKSKHNLFCILYRQWCENTPNVPLFCCSFLLVFMFFLPLFVAEETHLPLGGAKWQSGTPLLGDARWSRASCQTLLVTQTFFISAWEKMHHFSSADFFFFFYSRSAGCNFPPRGGNSLCLHINK